MSSFGQRPCLNGGLGDSRAESLGHSARAPHGKRARVDELEPDTHVPVSLDTPAIAQRLDEVKSPSRSLFLLIRPRARLEAQPAIGDLDADRLSRGAHRQLELIRLLGLPGRSR